MRAQPQWFLAAGSLGRRTARLWPRRPALVLRGRGALSSTAPSLRCAGLRRRDVFSGTTSLEPCREVWAVTSIVTGVAAWLGDIAGVSGHPLSSLPSLLLLVVSTGMLPEIGTVTLSCTGGAGQVWHPHLRATVFYDWFHGLQHHQFGPPEEVEVQCAVGNTARACADTAMQTNSAICLPWFW